MLKLWDRLWRFDEAYRDTFEFSHRTDEEIDDFRDHLTELSIFNCRIGIIVIDLIIVLTVPFDFVWLSEPELWTLLEFKAVVFPIFLFGLALLQFDYAREHWLICGSLFLGVLSFPFGFYLSKIQEPNSAAFFLIYLFPLLTVPLPADFKQRVFINLLSGFGIFLGIYVSLQPDIIFMIPIFTAGGTALCAGLVLGHTLFWRLNYINYYQQRDLEEEREKSERLLLNILPEEVADDLKQDRGEMIADGYDEVTVLFADIVDFTPLADDLRPTSVVRLLDDMMSSFDELIGKFPVEKIKTIGDEYFLTAGVPQQIDNHAVVAGELAVRMRDLVRDYKRTSGEHFETRIGLNTGPVVAGVIGTEKFVYDVWGDTVNIGSRMESQGKQGKIQVTAATRKAIQKQDEADRFEFESRGVITIKGKGTMETFFLDLKEP